MYIKLTNITKCFLIKRNTTHAMLKLPTNEIVFFPVKFIKELDEKTLEISLLPNMKFKANKARQELKKWVRYDYRTLDSADLVFLIMENDAGAKKC